MRWSELLDGLAQVALADDRVAPAVGLGFVADEYGKFGRVTVVQVYETLFQPLITCFCRWIASLLQDHERSRCQ